MSLIDDIKRDRAEGTPGPWVIGKDLEVSEDGFEYLLIVSGEKQVVVGCGCCGSPCGDCKVDPERIARVPDMEAALLAADRAIESFETCNPLDDKQLDEIDAAISAYREATK